MRESLLRLSIRGKLALGFGIQLALVAGVASAGLLGLRSVQGSFQSAIKHGLGTERLAAEMRKELLEARRAEKDFLLRWRSEGFDTAYAKYVVVNQQHLARVRELIAELEAAQLAGTMAGTEDRITEDLVALKPYVNVYAEDFAAAVELIGRRESGKAGPEGTAGGVEPVPFQARIDKRIEDFGAAAIVVEPLAADIALTGQQGAAAEIAAAESAGRQTVLLVGASLAAAMLAGLGLAYLLGNQIRLPLQNLARTAEAVGAGDLGAQAQVVSHDEIGTLAATFNAMTAQLRSLVASLEQRVLERKRAEEALRASEERFSKAFHANPTPMAITRMEDGLFLDANESYISLLGYAREELIGRRTVETGLLAPEHREEAMRLLSTQGRIQDMEFEVRAKSGEPRLIQASIEIIEVGGDKCLLSTSLDITERKRAEEQIQASLREKEVLLKEIHHRVKNNLQVITSLLSLQSQQTQEPDVRGLLKESQNRVRSMALVHEQLYRSKSLGRIDLAGYVRTLAAQLFRSYAIDPNLIRLRLEIEDVELAIDTAVPCGLLINELVSNALQHAFPRGRLGEVRVELRRQADGSLLLRVRDDGVGLPKELDFARTASLGLQLVTTLTEQLRGTIHLTGETGTSFEVSFAKPE